MPQFDPLLFGADETQGVVSVEPDLDSNSAVIFQRQPDGTTAVSSAEFVPWLLAASNGLKVDAEVRQLKGGGHNIRYDFPKTGWNGFLETRRQLRDQHIPVVSYGSKARQFLLGSGLTLFKGMAFGDLRRMQVDIETTTLSPHHSNARIILVAVSDTTGRSAVFDGDEVDVLEELADTIRRWDPDVIEGHNIYSFDLPYILARCSAIGVVFSVGRDPDKPVVSGAQRNCAMGANSRPFAPIYIYGRHILDTYFQVQRFDAPKGEISSYGLKECARVYKLSAQDRVLVDRATIENLYQSDPSVVRQYALQDAEETRALASLTSPTEFYQAQMVPDVYQSVAVTGTGEKVNSLLVREYLRQNTAIPLPSASSEYPGGYTEVRKVGLIKNVVKADVESLYPSLMLSERISPSSDTLGLFLPMLSDLTKRRLEAKATLRTVEKGSNDYSYWDGLQNSFKIFINSFYGYIGGPFYFNDYSAARQVTVSGQRTVKRIAEELETTGSTVIEIDTDGIYFQPPAHITDESLEEEYIQKIGQVLPTGIRLAHDGRYAAMLSLKIKNYVLVNYDGRKILKGSSLRSRADEPFGKAFLQTAIDLLLDENFSGFSALYIRTLENIQDGRLSIDDFSKRERVTEKMIHGTLNNRTGKVAKLHDFKEGDIINVYNRNDGTTALASEFNNDEDRSHYAQKLYKFAMRLVDAIGEEQFAILCPRPKSEQQRLSDKLQEAFDF